MALFPPGKGGGEEVEYGYKGKGILIHCLVEGQGMPLAALTTPANGDEGKQVEPLMKSVKIRTGKVGRPRSKLKVLAADRGYDAEWLRKKLRKKGIQPRIRKRVWKKAKPKKGRPFKKDKLRYIVERAFSWYQRKYRRLVVRWERLKHCFDAFLDLAIVHMWLTKLVG